MGYWQHSSYHDEAWDYLCNHLKPDLALLQEVKPPSWVASNTLFLQEITKGWGTAIYSPMLPLSHRAFSLYPGRVAAASTMLSKGDSLFIASIHAPIIDGRVFPHLANIFTELESNHDSSTAVVGGDLNSARLAEKVWPGYGHGPFFERIDRGDCWVDCCRQFHLTEIQTFFRNTCSHPFQDDHIFVRCDLRNRIKGCNVVNNELTRRVSDHIPLVAELDLSWDVAKEPFNI